MWLTDVAATNNPVMVVLMSVSVLAFAVFLERTWAWAANTFRRANPSALLEAARAGQGLDRGNLPARRLPHNPYWRVMRAWHDSNGHRGSVEQAIETEEAVLKRNLWMLDCAATVGPLLGILGTLIGLCQSFQGFESITRLDPARVAKGISLALNTTVVGLMIAVGAVVSAHLFRRLADRAVRNLEDFAEALLSIRER